MGKQFTSKQVCTSSIKLDMTRQLNATIVFQRRDVNHIDIHDPVNEEAAQL